MRTYIPLSTVDAQDLDRDEGVAPATLAVRKRPENATVQLADAEKLFRLCGTPYANLSKTGDILASARWIPVPVAGRARLHSKRFPGE